jgi:hypothetical protein
VLIWLLRGDVTGDVRWKAVLLACDFAWLWLHPVHIAVAMHLAPHCGTLNSVTVTVTVHGSGFA